MKKQLVLEADTYKRLVDYHLERVTELENSDIIKFDEIKCEIQKSIYWADRLAELDKKNKKILLKNLKKESKNVLKEFIKNLLSQQ